MNLVANFFEALGLAHPITYLLLFVAASLLMLWRLEAMMDHGLEGTALGTLVMPYCSGLGNLIFVVLLLRGHGEPQEVMTNCLVNNTTNLTLLLALPALIWGLEVLPRGGPQKSGKRSSKAGAAETKRELNRLSLLFTMLAVVFFTGAVWALGQDGNIDRADGLVLIGLFLFWQCFQVFDVLKHNVRERRSFSALFYLDLVLLLLGAVFLYASLDWLVRWLAVQQTGFVSAANLGWLSGWLMVLPNALLAFYYAARGRADVVYASQIGDGHICIPLCVGLFALFRPIPMPAFFGTGVYVLFAAVALHFVAVLVTGRLPRWASWLLLGAYAWFVYIGLIN